eukprot:TRINITY_DN15733_c0_g2_i1.p1 TRINITY_DN15733_c0_g2~~TRINITY_DN15733_c0_g2_i1.p1  ORF type:complete len:330 (-),score=38.58 TRINITY_DN15733_c0_g2_i1:92-946(-)
MAGVSKIIGPRASTEEKLMWRSLLSIFFTILGHFCAFNIKDLGRPKRIWLLVLRGLCGHLALLAYLESIERLPLAEAVFLGKVHPLAAAIFSRIFLGEKLHPARIVAIIASLGGVALVANPSWEAFMSGNLLGSALALFAGTLSGAAYCCVRAIGRSGEAELWSLLALPLVSVPCCLPTILKQNAGSRTFLTSDWKMQALFLSLGLCTQGGQVFLSRGLSLLPAASGTQAMYFGTVSGVAMGTFLGDDWPSLQTWAGGIIIVISLQLAEFFESRSSPGASKKLE